MSDTIFSLKAALNRLISNSKDNELIAQKLFEIETEVLSCQSSEGLLKRLLESIKDKFNITNITLLLVSPTPISYLINSNLQSSWHQNHSVQNSAPKISFVSSDEQTLFNQSIRLRTTYYS